MKKERNVKKLLLLVLAIVLSACTTIANAGQPKSEVEQARDKWQAANISHYRFNLRLGCFCAFSQDMPLVIEVKDGQVISMKYQSGKEVEPGNLEYFQRFATMDQLFDEIANDFQIQGNVDATGDKADEVKVTYDETYGFPTQISIDFIKDAVDDELGLTISAFEKLP
jgi:predicted small secreted protein